MSDALEGKWGVQAHQTQEMKGKEGSGDPTVRQAKRGLASSGRWLDTSGEKGFLLMQVDVLRPCKVRTSVVLASWIVQGRRYKGGL